MSKIEDALKDYFQEWNSAFKSKDDRNIRHYLSNKFTGFWAKSALEEVAQYDYNYDIHDVLIQYDQNTTKSFQSDSIIKRLEGKECLITGTETSVINNIPYRAKCMFVWCFEEDGWKLLREYIELER